MVDQQNPLRHGWTRRGALGLAAIFLAVATVESLRHVDWYPIDYLAFWAAGRLAVAGNDPYDPDSVLAHQQEVVGQQLRSAVVCWNPPCFIPFVVPFAFMSAGAGVKFMLLTQLGLTVVAADLAWRAFKGPAERRPLSWALTTTFVPTAVLLSTGQITAWCCFGVAGYAAAMRSGRPILAGVCAALTAIKPHLLAVFCLSLLIDAFTSQTGRRATLAGGLLILVEFGAAEVLSPGSLQSYLAAATATDSDKVRPLVDWSTPALGSAIRSAIAPANFGVQCAPLAVAVVGLIAVRVAASKSWNPVAAVPWLVLVSLVVAPYGVWTYDLVMLLIPVILVAVLVANRQIGSWAVGTAVLIYILVNVTMIITIRFNLIHMRDAWYVLPAIGIMMGIVWRGSTNGKCTVIGTDSTHASQPNIASSDD